MAAEKSPATSRVEKCRDGEGFEQKKGGVHGPRRLPLESVLGSLLALCDLQAEVVEPAVEIGELLVAEVALAAGGAAGAGTVMVAGAAAKLGSS